MRTQLTGQWAPWGQKVELGARGTGRAASSLGQLLSPKKSHVPLSPATERGSAKGRTQNSQLRKPCTPRSIPQEQAPGVCCCHKEEDVGHRQNLEAPTLKPAPGKGFDN